MIHYICGYANDNSKIKRIFSPAGATKMEYIFGCFEKLGKDYRVYSTCQVKSHKFVKKKKERDIVYRASFRTNNKYTFWLDRIFAIIQLFFYLLRVKKEDCVVVYHERFYLGCIQFVSKLKKFTLFYEIEEIYTIAKQHSQKSIDKEIKALTKGIKRNLIGYIFPTDLLNEKINRNNLPFVLIHGTYNVEKDYGGKFNDGRIHCVYAGTFDPRKGGVAAAAAAAQFLNEKYHIHILGFGSKKDEELLKKQIDDISKNTKCKITFEGLKSGEDYNRFIQKCDIGLSTQNPNAAFNDTSFPSKILSYMANGLRVVSIRIPAVENSEIGEFMYYYNEQIPQEIAEAIHKVDLTDGYDGREVIKKLSVKFLLDLNSLLS
ncbi:MAG: glycosyltransferase [Clostridia bacterium]|nr:glycosyltransferase [Clostridia bacterium]